MLTPQQVEFLQRQGFSSGLIRALDTTATAVPLRCWIVDNSISMSQPDAHIISGFIDNVQMRPGTRWDEVRSTVVYHAHLAAQFNMPTRFTMLNSTDPYSQSKTYSIAEYQNVPSSNITQQQIQILEQALKSSFPSGATPITKHLVGVRDHVVLPMADQLRRNNQRIVIVLATDGLPSSDRSEQELLVPDFLNVLRSLESLPVWIVFRLCTDEERVFDFYNSLDAQFNLPCDVLDDLIGEALEVYLRNPWLTYALPLHRLREMGFPHSIMDALDERALTLAELHGMCSLLFSANLPDPGRDWSYFLRALAQVMAQEKIQWNPVTKVLSPWIDLARLHTVYGRGMPFPHDIAYRGPQPLPGSAQMRQSTFPSPNAPPPPSAGFVPQPQRPMPWQNQQSGIPTGPSAPRPAPQPNAFYQQRQQPQQCSQAPPPQSTSHYMRQTTTASTTGDKTSSIKTGILRGWALAPPNYQHLHSLDYLLGSVQTTFPPANAVAPHPYFQKFQPFAADALASRDPAVLKRAVRKMKFFLHPDKLPRDFVSEQSLVCKILWDTIADASEEFQKANP